MVLPGLMNIVVKKSVVDDEGIEVIDNGRDIVDTEAGSDMVEKVSTDIFGRPDNGFCGTLDDGL